MLSWGAVEATDDIATAAAWRASSGIPSAALAPSAKSDVGSSFSLASLEELRNTSMGNLQLTKSSPEAWGQPQIQAASTENKSQSNI
jgi:hypothetical protein